MPTTFTRKPDAYIARDVQEVGGIVARIVSARQHGIVAGGFRQRRQPVLQPPGQRMKPEDRTIEQRQPLHERIAATDGFVLVGQDGVQLRVRPLAPPCRQNRDGTEPSHRDGRCA